MSTQHKTIDLLSTGTEGNFQIVDPSFVTTQGVPYDIRSIMHYSSRAFTSNGNPTILPLDTSIHEGQLGQRLELTDFDLQHVATLYCDGELKWLH